MRDKITDITRLCGQLLETEELDAVQPVGADLQPIHDRIETVRQGFGGIVLIDRIVELEEIAGTPTNETCG